jgi:hypothetical protein
LFGPEAKGGQFSGRIKHFNPSLRFKFVLICNVTGFSKQIRNATNPFRNSSYDKVFTSHARIACT